MNFEVCATTYEEGGRTVAWKRGLNFVEAVEEAGSWGMAAESVAEFAALIHKTAFAKPEDELEWSECYVEKMDADPFTVYIGVEL
jgi:hypothetical protein